LETFGCGKQNVLLLKRSFLHQKFQLISSGFKSLNPKLRLNEGCTIQSNENLVEYIAKWVKKNYQVSISTPYYHHLRRLNLILNSPEAQALTEQEIKELPVHNFLRLSNDWETFIDEVILNLNGLEIESITAWHRHPKTIFDKFASLEPGAYIFALPANVLTHQGQIHSGGHAVAFVITEDGLCHFYDPNWAIMKSIPRELGHHILGQIIEQTSHYVPSPAGPLDYIKNAFIKVHPQAHLKDEFISASLLKIRPNANPKI